MEPILIDPLQFAGSAMALMIPIVALVWLLRAPPLRSRREALERSRRSRKLNDLPAELRWRVLERDDYACQRCGTKSDLLVDCRASTPDGHMVRLAELSTHCVRCAALNHRSETTIDRRAI